MYWKIYDFNLYLNNCIGKCMILLLTLLFDLEKEEQEILDWLLPPQEGETKWFDLIAH